MPCVICKGNIKNGKVNFPIDLGTNFVLIKHVPAHVCEQCGEYFLEDDVAAVVEKIAENARSSNAELEILTYAA